MQSVSSRIWTRVAVFISYDDNNYTTGTSTKIVYIVVGKTSRESYVQYRCFLFFSIPPSSSGVKTVHHTAISLFFLLFMTLPFFYLFRNLRISSSFLSPICVPFLIAKFLLSVNFPFFCFLFLCFHFYFHSPPDIPFPSYVLINRSALLSAYFFYRSKLFG